MNNYDLALSFNLKQIFSPLNLLLENFSLSQWSSLAQRDHALNAAETLKCAWEIYEESEVG